MEADDLQDEPEVGRVYDGRLLRRLLGYLRPVRGMATLAVSLILVSASLQLVAPLLTAAAVDLFVQPAEPSAFTRWLGTTLDRAGWSDTPAAGVTSLAVVYVAVLALTFVVLYAQGYVMQMMGQRIMHDLRRDVFASLQALPVPYFDRHPAGRLVTRATTDVAALNELFTAGLVQIFGDLLLLVGIMAVLFAIHWQLALVSFVVLPLLLLLSRWFKGRARRSYRAVRVHVARINAFLQEHVSGMSLVQLFGREASTASAFDEINEDHREANVQAIRYYAVYYPAIDVVTALGLALIIWYGGGRVLAGTLTFGFLIAYLQYAQRFYRPISDLSDKMNILQAAMASAERIFALVDTDRVIESPPRAFSPAAVRGEIVFDRVRFGYRAEDPVLHDLSFRIEPGQTVAVVGHTGAGKSTLANLILRFYDVDHGGVRVDGTDVREWDLHALRRATAMVLQDVVLFSGSLADNIRLGNPEIDDDRLRWAAREVGALDFIERLPDGFATEVHERGAGLSTGQRQLIAFARALAVDPKILILDEATASIDTETEQRIQAALERLRRGRTSLVIAHRLSTIQNADRILVLHRGCLREEGTHNELLNQGGLYRTLYELQAAERPVATATTV